VRAIVLALGLVACADHKPVPNPTGAGSAVTTTSGSAAAGSGTTMNASVTISVAGRKPGRPPIDRLLVDVQLKNDDASAKWVLIPSKVPPEAGKGGIDKLEQLTAPAGQATVAVGRFLGTGGRYALRIAPGARVTLRKLEVAWWNESNAKSIALDVQLAGDVKLGTEDMATWFDKDPTISGAVDVDMEAAKHTASHRAKDDVEVPVGITGATTTPFTLTP
jgi:hypothetical protein